MRRFLYSARDKARKILFRDFMTRELVAFNRRQQLKRQQQQQEQPRRSMFRRRRSLSTAPKSPVPAPVATDADMADPEVDGDGGRGALTDAMATDSSLSLVFGDENRPAGAGEGTDTLLYTANRSDPHGAVLLGRDPRDARQRTFHKGFGFPRPPGLPVSEAAWEGLQTPNSSSRTTAALAAAVATADRICPPDRCFSVIDNNDYALNLIASSRCASPAYCCTLSSYSAGPLRLLP